MTALSIVQNACGRMSLDQPSVLFSSTNSLDIQMRSLLNQEAKEASTRHSWVKLTSEASFTTVAAAAQTSAIPSDFSWYINETMFNRTSDRPVLGPLTPQEWQAEQASMTTGIYSKFRFRGTDIIFTPTPTAGDSVYYEYIKNTPVLSVASVAKTAFTADDDTGVLDEELSTLGLIWRFKKSKGFDYAEDFNAYEKYLELLIGKDGGKRSLNLGSPKPSMWPNIPENGFG